jgi:type VI secretion system protein ImpA
MSTPLPNLDALLAPIPGEDKGGSSGTYFEMRPQLEEMRREVNPNEYPDDDPMRLEPMKRADWRGIEHRTVKALQQETKDVRVAGHLVEALVKQHGFAGLGVGLRLIHGLVEHCWDFLYPAIEDGDVSSRVLPLENMLDDPVRGLRLPTSIRAVALVSGDGASFGFLDWDAIQKANNPEQREAFERALQAMPGDRAAADLAAIEENLQELGKLAATLEAKIGPTAPGLLRLRDALEDCRRLALHVVEKTQGARPVAAAESNTPAAGAAAAPTPGPAATTAVAASREDAYRQLKAAADLLQRLEPHSPVPYLVHKAVQLGALPFPQLIRALIRDANVLGELNRELGIKETPE